MILYAFEIIKQYTTAAKNLNKSNKKRKQKQDTQKTAQELEKEKEKKFKNHFKMADGSNYRLKSPDNSLYRL